MPRQKSPELRARTPTQERARGTVAAILEAAVQVLVEVGAEALTTRRVAERAGVSIGTLYQYFPNKEALVLALAERQSDEIMEGCAAALERAKGRTSREAARELVAALLAVYGRNLVLQRALASEVAMRDRLRIAQRASERVEQLLRFFLESQPDRPARPELAAFLVTRAVQAAAWSAVLERPELANAPELLDELHALAAGYLEPRRAE